MKIKLNKFFFWSIVLQIIATQGILTFIIFKFFGNWEIKKLIHPLSFFIVCTLFVIKAIKKITITIVDVFFVLYFFILFIILLFNVGSFQSLYIAFREVYLLFVLIFIFEKLEFYKNEWSKILNFLFFLLLLNTIFIVLTYVLGPIDYMKLMTGRFLWGVDPEYGFKISNFSMFWRTPALIGNPASLGFFSVLTYLLMDQDENFKKRKYFSLIPLIFSFVRSVYLILIVYEFLKFFTKKKNLKKLIFIFKVGIPIVILVIILLAKKSIFSTASLYARFHLWSTELVLDYNVFYGGAIGQIGGAARTVQDSFIQTVDSYWFYLLLSTGVIGIFMVIIFILDKSKKNNKFLFILIAIFLSGLFVNLTQSIVFLAIFPLLFVKIKKTEIKDKLDK